MTVVPISQLSLTDLRLLGNNFCRRRRRSALSLAAVNRSLALHGDSIDRLSLSTIKTLASARRNARMW